MIKGTSKACCHNTNLPHGLRPSISRAVTEGLGHGISLGYYSSEPQLLSKNKHGSATNATIFSPATFSISQATSKISDSSDFKTYLSQS